MGMETEPTNQKMTDRARKEQLEEELLIDLRRRVHDLNHLTGLTVSGMFITFVNTGTNTKPNDILLQSVEITYRKLLQ